MTNINFRNAVKAFIVKDNHLLLIKRRPNDVHSPGEWDIPGGRLTPGEDPFEGLRRETREEVRLEIKISVPLDVHYFTRDDRQKIQLTIFFCQPESGEIKLSEEHTEYKWLDLSSDLNEFPGWLQKIVKQVNKANYEQAENS